MKRNHRMLLISAAVLCAALLLMLLFAWTSKRTQETPEEETQAGFTFDPADVTDLSLENGTTTLSLTLRDGVWHLQSDPEYPVSAAAVTELLEALCIKEIQRNISPVDDSSMISDYGMGTEYVSVTDKNGTRTLSVGKANALSGCRYVADSAVPETVYLLEADALDGFFAADIASLFDGDVLETVTAATLREAVLTVGESTYRFTWDAVGTLGESGTVHWTLSENGSRNVTVEDTDETLIADLCTLQFGQVLSWKSADAEAYGIDGTRTLTVSTEKTVSVVTDGNTTYAKQAQTVSLEIGVTEDGMLTARRAGGHVIYRLSPGSLVTDLLAAVDKTHS